MKLLEAHENINIEDDSSLKLVGKALHSCQFWWASCRPNWSSLIVQEGARLMLSSSKTLYNNCLLNHRSYQNTKHLVAKVIKSTVTWEKKGISKKRINNYKKYVGNGPLYTFDG